TALNSSQNSSFLRSSSFLAVIILSDEDDFSGNSRSEGGGNDHDYNASTLESVQTYINYLDALTTSTGATRRYNVNSITVMDNNCLNQHIGGAPSSIIGQRYMQISQATNGITGSICDASYANNLSNIAAQIATLSSQFFLDKTPQVNTIVV